MTNLGLQAVFGIGGIQPFGSASGSRAGIAPVPWLPEAPRGSAVWRSQHGGVSAAWSAEPPGGTVTTTGLVPWHAWVNVSVPALSDGASVQVMLPRSTEPAAFCAWECGRTTATYTSRWVSFDAGGGHFEHHAVVPPRSQALAPAQLATCAPLWSKGAASKSRVAGIEAVAWVAARPGHTMFPALSLAVTSGAYTIYTRAC